MRVRELPRQEQRAGPALTPLQTGREVSIGPSAAMPRGTTAHKWAAQSGRAPSGVLRRSRAEPRLGRARGGTEAEPDGVPRRSRPEAQLCPGDPRWTHAQPPRRDPAARCQGTTVPARRGRGAWETTNKPIPVPDPRVSAARLCARRCTAFSAPAGGAAGPPAARSGRSAPVQPRAGGRGVTAEPGALRGPRAPYPVVSARRRLCRGRPGSAPLPSAAPGPAPSPPQRSAPHAAPTARPELRCCRLLTFPRLLLLSEICHRRYSGNNYTQLFSTTPLTKKMAFKL